MIDTWSAEAKAHGASRGSFRVVSRALRNHLYPIPALTRRYLREMGEMHKWRVLGPRIGLDLRAGNSPFRNDMTKHFGLRDYTAVDLAPSEQTDLVADVQDLSLSNESATHIFALELLHHVPDINAAFSEINRVLKPGGLLLISFPFLFGECEMVDCRRWSVEGMQQELTSRGFCILDIRQNGGPLFAFASAMHLAVQLIIPGGRGHWRRDVSVWTILRGAFVFLLTVPTAAFGWLCLFLDRLIPIKTLRGFYQGGFVLAQKLPSTDP